VRNLPISPDGKDGARYDELRGRIKADIILGAAIRRRFGSGRYRMQTASGFDAVWADKGMSGAMHLSGFPRAPVSEASFPFLRYRHGHCNTALRGIALALIAIATKTGEGTNRRMGHCWAQERSSFMAGYDWRAECAREIEGANRRGKNAAFIPGPADTYSDQGNGWVRGANTIGRRYGLRRVRDMLGA